MYIYNPFTRKLDQCWFTSFSGAGTFVGLSDTPGSYHNNSLLVSSYSDIGYVPKSVITISGTYIGVGQPAPQTFFHIQGNAGTDIIGDNCFMMGTGHVVNYRDVYDGLLTSSCDNTVIIGEDHTLGSDDCCIYGGILNLIDAPINPGNHSVIVSGMYNEITSSGTGAFHNNLGRDFIGSGQFNTINILCNGHNKGRGIIVGGDNNIVTGDHGIVVGGGYNNVSGDYGVVPGGSLNEVDDLFGFAAGYKAKSRHSGAFVWSDFTPGVDFESVASDEFAVRAAGGVRLVADVTISGVLNMPSNPPATAGSVGNRGDIAWDEDYFYVCISGSTWKRSSLNSW